MIIAMKTMNPVLNSWWRCRVGAVASIDTVARCGTGSREIHLPIRKAQSLSLAGGQEILCREGQVWITQSGRAGDRILGAGDFLTVDSPGRVVVESLAAESVVQVFDRCNPRRC